MLSTKIRTFTPEEADPPELRALREQTIAGLRRALPEREWNPVKLWLGTFYPFQLDWLLDFSRFALSLKARQLGASHSYGGQGTLWGMFGESTIVVSIGERESSEVLDKTHRHSQALAALGSDWARVTRRSKREIRFASGGRVVALPSTSGGRGYTGNVVLDEFAYHEHPDEVWDGAGGAIMHGYRIRVNSTPNGVGNLFHQLCTDPVASDGYRKHQVTIDRAIAQGFPVDLATCMKMARGDARVFDQMFRCSFLDSAMQYIPTDAITAAATDERPSLDGEVFAGLDVGRTANRTELVILREVDGILWELARETRKRTSYADLEALASIAFNTYGARRLAIDATGMGAFPAEQLAEKFGSHRVIQFVFGANSKETLATGMFHHFVERKLRLLRDDKQLRDDVALIRRVVTRAGNVTYDALNGPEGHADAAWALALAIHASTQRSARRHEVYTYEDDDE